MYSLFFIYYYFLSNAGRIFFVGRIAIDWSPPIIFDPRDFSYLFQKIYIFFLHVFLRCIKILKMSIEDKWKDGDKLLFHIRSDLEKLEKSAGSDDSELHSIHKIIILF